MGQLEHLLSDLPVALQRLDGADPPDLVRRSLALALPAALAAGCLPLLACSGGRHDAENSVVSQARRAQLAHILPQFETWAAEMLARSGVPGMAIGIVLEPHIDYLKGFGVRRADAPHAVDVDTVFPLASLSKPIASTVIAAALSHRTAWDTRIALLDTDFALSDPAVTAQLALRDLLSHSSGLPGGTDNLLEELGYSRAEIIRRLRCLPLAQPFRQGFQYTNMPFSVAGFALAKSRGLAWEDMCETLLYRPLGMVSTSSRHADFLARQNRVHSHIVVDGRHVERYDRNADPQSPAGGVSASVRDVCKWMCMHLADGVHEGSQLINADVLRATREPVISTAASGTDPASRYYGLGWSGLRDGAGRARISHSGGFNRGAATHVLLIPSEQLGIVVLTNGAPGGLPEAVANGFLDFMSMGMVGRDWFALFSAVLKDMLQPNLVIGNDYSVKPPDPIPPLPLSAYVGRYENAVYGALEIRQSGDALRMEIGPQNISRMLMHWNANTFIDALQAPSLPATGTIDTGPGDLDIHYLGGLIFAMDIDGKATSLRIEELDQHGEGSFMRI